MQLSGRGAVGTLVGAAPTRRLNAPCQVPTLPQRCCKAQAGHERRAGPGLRSGSGAAAPPKTWVLPSLLVPESHLPSTDDAWHATDASSSSPEEPDTGATAPLTVYTIRLTTGTSRGAALSDPYSAVNVCLVGANGKAALHRICPINDFLESRAHTLEMCQAPVRAHAHAPPLPGCPAQLIGPDVGADCSNVLAESGNASGSGSVPAAQQPQQRATQGSAAVRGGGPSSSGSTSLVGRAPPPPPPKRRFQEGMVDEVSILVPELGPLASVLVGVEGGTWYLDEMDVSSSRTHHMDRFVCRRSLGGREGEGAAMLTPVPAGAVVYGEGEAAVVLTKEQATALWSLNMNDYGDLKRRLAGTTALLVASGASLAALTGGTAAALPYAAGGAVGLVYQWMLMRGVDHVVVAASGQQKQQQALQGGGSSGSDGNSEQQRGGDGTMTSGGSAARILGSAPVRLAFVCASAALGLALLGQEEAATGGAAGALSATAAASDGSTAAWQLALAGLGFLTYKVALVGVSLGDSAASVGSAARSVAARAASSSSHKAEVEKYKRD